ncbi:threonylcarbamoyl-AMP synthase [Rhodohalobacter sp. SW132]|uniref:L-threonylcarbamoyladenylate synthase n=1 Tax=Rhodohalobacter sp. SW132 TaxID=2293433 RepID=UPI000E269209|nr:L-threonylcarbamoyladenylate synthase [Rhodohalobacter sp. SW132]REL37706.1 threonylcarbamoyl-AMP synthase [Rhodohalobacter sp. SW132]
MIVSVTKASEIIRAGGLVAIPTETVYGLAADASNALAVQKTFNVKGRPADNPLIVHISSLNQVSDFASEFPDFAQKLAAEFWPGPLTIVLKKKNSVLDLVTAGLDTVALRMPNHPLALHLISMSGPVTAPSANRSGLPSPTRPAHVTDDFGPDFPVLDGGECTIGIESTVIDLSTENPVILRPGRISTEEISQRLSVAVDHTDETLSDLKKSPGTRYTHYKPRADVQWLPSGSEITLHQDELYIFHSGTHQTNSNNVIDFAGDFDALGRAIYDLYRTADRRNYTNIYIEPLPNPSDHPMIPPLLNRIQKSVSQ